MRIQKSKENSAFTSKSQRWSDPELKPLVSESTGLLERESNREWDSSRELSRAMLNLSWKSGVLTGAVKGKPRGFPRMLPRVLLGMPNTEREAS